jgi:hypothetical protein
MGVIKHFLIFFRSMVFEKKEEYDITSPFFNLKKVIVVLTMSILIMYSAAMTYVVLKIGYKYHGLQRACLAKNQDEPSSNSQKPQIMEKSP